MQMARRLDALEKAAGQGDGMPAVTSIWHNLIAPDDAANGRPNGWLGIVTIIGGETFNRADDEDKTAFIARAAEGYRAVHGPVPDSWGQDNAAA